MTLVEINNDKYAMPSKFNELSSSQLIAISDLQTKQLSKEYLEIQVIRYLLGITWKEYNNLDGFALKKLANAIRFIHSESKLTLQLLPTVKVKKTTFTGAESGLQNFTFEQFFAYSEPTFFAFLEQKKERFLNELLAIVYTQNNVFNSNQIEQNALFLAKLEPKIKMVILHFYTGCRSYIIKQFPVAFSGGSKKQVDGYEFLNLLEQLNNEDVTKNELIRKVNLYEMLVKLNKK